MNKPDIIRAGDLTATLYCGDCLDILPGLGKVDAVITDPPYGKALSNNDRSGHRSKRWDTIAGDESPELGRSVLKALANVPFVAAFAAPELPWPGKWRNRIVWDKGGAVGGGGDTATCLKRTWELLQVNNTGRLRYRSGSVWRFPMTPNDTADHICAKPVALLEELIDTFMLTGTILDPFMGSGSSGVAALRMGCNFIGIEISEEYYEIAKRRIGDEAAQRKLFA